MQLKHLFCAVVGFSLLTACYSYKLDDAEGRAERIAEKRTENGCKTGDIHKNYRDCVLATAQNNSPKTYTTGEDTQGRPIAVLKSDKPCTSCVATQETVVEVATPVITQTVEMIETVKTVEITTPSEPIKPDLIAEPKITETIVTTVETEAIVEDVPMPTDKTWWDKYNAEKKSEPVVQVKCPCEDPNDPCPQCIQK